MSHSLPRLSVVLRLLAATALVASAAVHADDYGDVSQLLKTGKLAEAQAKADLYLTVKPKDPQMRFLKSAVQSAAGQPAEAITTLTALTQEFPELPEPYNNLAVLYASQNQYDKARTTLEMAVRINPTYATAYENLGDVYAKMASQSYSKSLQLNATNTQASQKVALLKTVLAPAAPATPVAPAKTK
ncbi:tetratricopeptide repeat protein [Rhodoferax sp.]|uniref:tetratricopeptide repeat protein n=1 Tax=Rhodoferax sp. TaxID=50421 RepID=UPI0025F5F71A|nr:tetratricopeptide repeat protein [Rhodoferax sp.]